MRPFRTSIHLDKFPVSRIGLRFDEGIFRMGNNRLHGCGFVCLIVELKFSDNAFYKRQGIGGIVDGEVVTIAEPVGIGSEYAGENGVKRPCPQALSLSLFLPMRRCVLSSRWPLCW